MSIMGLDVARVDMGLDTQGSQDGELVFGDPSMGPVMELASLAAQSSVVVLLEGESGTGKEMLARFIHRRSGRSGEFVAVNCAALPDNLLESELFGHERGAFTGATQRRIGCFEAARGGTILLDEISELSLPLQAKLLRVLQEFRIRRVGSTTSIPVDVKVVATSNRDLRGMVEQGLFRRDLYYRLRVFPIQIPALRERPGDIRVLAEFFVRRYAKQHGKPVTGLDRDAMAALLRHQWPGNVRELENTISRAVILAQGGLIRPMHLLLESQTEALGGVNVPALPHGEPVGSGDEVDRVLARLAGMPLAELETRMILLTLEAFGGNRTRTAQALGISIRTLRNRLRAYRDAGLEVPEPPSGRDPGDGFAHGQTLPGSRRPGVGVAAAR